MYPAAVAIDSRLILPSDDQPQTTGQEHMAEGAVPVPHPLQVRGRTYADAYLVPIADKEHVEAIARTMLFEAP